MPPSGSEAAAVEALAPRVQPIIACSPGFHGWLAAQGVNLSLTTRRLFLIGRKPDGGLSG